MEFQHFVLQMQILIGFLSKKIQLQPQAKLQATPQVYHISDEYLEDTLYLYGEPDTIFHKHSI